MYVGYRGCATLVGIALINKDTNTVTSKQRDRPVWYQLEGKSGPQWQLRKAIKRVNKRALDKAHCRPETRSTNNERIEAVLW